MCTRSTWRSTQAIKQTSEGCQLRFNETFVRTLIERLNKTSEAPAETTHQKHLREMAGLQQAH